VKGQKVEIVKRKKRNERLLLVLLKVRVILQVKKKRRTKKKNQIKQGNTKEAIQAVKTRKKMKRKTKRSVTLLKKKETREVYQRISLFHLNPMRKAQLKKQEEVELS